MINLAEELINVKKAGIAGHINPDGDAVGACLGLYHYLKQNYPEIETRVFLDNIPSSLSSIPGIDQVEHAYPKATGFDLFFGLDCADEERLGGAAEFLKQAGKTICIDHHISNCGYADINYIVPSASSTSELICGILEDEKLPPEAAEALFMGIVHDTGVFRHSCTAPETMEIAAKLMRKGISASSIINKTYYDKTYRQHQIAGKALMESMLLMDGKVIISAVSHKDMEFYGVQRSDLDGIVQQMMGTTGVEAAIFMYELEPQIYKVSLRSRELVDVSCIAAYFGGGGHMRAAGCIMQGSIHDVANNITLHIEQQLSLVSEID